MIKFMKKNSKNHFKEHQHNNLSHCIMQIKSYKKLTKKPKMNDFEEKKNGGGSKINHST